ncbi:uncharacterized protein LOC119346909 [Triticum dicoccoides]|nr:uncharacterized protein LOC119346909 [Triticum dicoccoides]
MPDLAGAGRQQPMTLSRLLHLPLLFPPTFSIGGGGGGGKRKEGPRGRRGLGLALAAHSLRSFLSRCSPVFSFAWRTRCTDDRMKNTRGRTLRKTEEQCMDLQL